MINIYNKDCIVVLKEMADKSIDAIITDPPYGIANVWKGGFGSGWGRAREQTEKRNTWDVAPSEEYINEILRVGKKIIIWGGNYFNLPISRGWLVWNKPERGFSLAEAELAWTNIDMPIRTYYCRRSDPDREHPTQKPLSLMKWCVERFTQIGDVVFDPYMGSGTTGVACVQYERNFIGAEIDKEYFAIAEKRIAEAQMQPRLL